MSDKKMTNAELVAKARAQAGKYSYRTLIEELADALEAAERERDGMRERLETQRARNAPLENALTASRAEAERLRAALTGARSLFAEFEEHAVRRQHIPAVVWVAGKSADAVSLIDAALAVTSDATKALPRLGQIARALRPRRKRPTKSEGGGR